MNKMVVLFILCTSIVQAHYTRPSLGPTHESVEQAKQRFACMSARQINNMDMQTLTPNQLQGFKGLAKDIFHTDIATPGCYSKANIIKYEVMYQKIGQIDQPTTL